MDSLNAAKLNSITSVATPRYARADLHVGIVHFGMGNFHRSHEAMYLDQLLETGKAADWGVCGVGLMPQDEAMLEVMQQQDHLYTLVLRHPDGSLEAKVIGSVIDYVFAPNDPEAVLARLVDPAVRIVSLTVTEGGYLKHPVTGDFDAEHPAVKHDAQHRAEPQTAFGFIVEGLRRRRAAGTQPFTVLSCDNLQGNGGYAKNAVVGFARLVDADLAAWIEDSVAFPNCMVDRITPATTDADREVVRSQFGYLDRWPVPGEPFTQWIVEDDFPAGRPPLEEVGVQFVPDVTPYELMKLRLLNASHQAIAYLGAPLGYVYVDEAMRDEWLRRYLLAYMHQEARPTLGELPGIDVDRYIDTLIERFSNPHMRDTLLRLATDGANRMATFTLPTIRANLQAERSIDLGALMVAAWAQMWQAIGGNEPPKAGVPEDEHSATMIAAAREQVNRPAAFLEIETLFGDLGRDVRFRAAFARARDLLIAHGVHGATRELLGGSGA